VRNEHWRNELLRNKFLRNKFLRNKFLRNKFLRNKLQGLGYIGLFIKYLHVLILYFSPIEFCVYME